MCPGLTVKYLYFSAFCLKFRPSCSYFGPFSPLPSFTVDRISCFFTFCAVPQPILPHLFNEQRRVDGDRVQNLSMVSPKICAVILHLHSSLANHSSPCKQVLVFLVPCALQNQI